LEITLERIAELVGGEVLGNKGFIITGINSLDDAGPSEISFLLTGDTVKASRKPRPAPY